MFLIFDTETTGLPIRDDAPLSDLDNWPRAVQVAWQLHGKDGKLIEARDFVIEPDGFDIPFNASKIHGITNEVAHHYGTTVAEALAAFEEVLAQTTYLVGHNIQFDINVLGAEFLRLKGENPMEGMPLVDTSEETREFCQLPGGKGGGFKIPRLEELYQKLFDETFAEAHNAIADVEATARVFLESIRRGIVPPEKAGFDEKDLKAFHDENPGEFKLIGLDFESFKDLARKLQAESESTDVETSIEAEQASSSFVHLHVHTQYSILQATSDIPGLVTKAKEMGMPAVAMTDFGNLYGAFQFVETARQQDLKPIVGCEFFVCRNPYRQVRKGQWQAGGIPG